LHQPVLRWALGVTLCAIVLAIAAGIATAASGTSASAPGRDYFGMNAQGVFKLPEAEWDLQLAAIARTGVGVVRRDAFWSEVERSAPMRGVHRYVWTRPDAIVAALARHGLRWYPILDYATTWAGSGAGPKRWKSAPTDPADFAAYARAFAQRYGRDGSFWSANPDLPALPVNSYEVWNEPNLADFWPDVSGAADRYGDLLAVTAQALRAGDPDGRVVVGGLSSTGLLPFLDRIEVRHPELIARMDAVGFHPYGTSFANTGARVRTLRDWLDRHGAAALPIEITETGWATPPLSESTRAVRMSVLVTGLEQSSCDISRFIAHTWVTPDIDPSDANDFFGLADADSKLKQTGAAFVEAVASAKAGVAEATDDPCAGRSPVVDRAPNATPAPAAVSPIAGPSAAASAPQSTATTTPAATAQPRSATARKRARTHSFRTRHARRSCRRLARRKRACRRSAPARRGHDANRSGSHRRIGPRHPPVRRHEVSR
jgi:hypothetical protein